MSKQLKLSESKMILGVCAGLAEYLGDLEEVDNVAVVNVGKLITFNFKGKAMKIDLIETRVKKN